MPGPRLFIPGGGVGPAGPPGPPGPPGGGLVLKDHGVILGPITSLDAEGANILASIAGADGTLTSPPPPPPTFGYWSGGLGVGFANTKITNRLDFTNDAVAMLAKGSLTEAGPAIGLNSSLKGYFLSDFVGAGVVDALIFAADAANMLHVTTYNEADVDVNSVQGSVNSTTHGYWAGGNANLGIINNRSIDFAADGMALAAKGALTVPRFQLAGGNSATHGYFAGGQASGVIYSSTDRLDFAVDANPMVAAGVLFSPRVCLAGANSTVFAYFSGGSTVAFAPAVVTNTDRLDFASDGNAMISKGALTVAVENLAGANSDLKAYFAGGNTAVINVTTNNALTFASDGVAMVARGALTQVQAQLGACQSGGIL